MVKHIEGETPETKTQSPAELADDITRRLGKTVSMILLLSKIKDSPDTEEEDDINVHVQEWADLMADYVCDIQNKAMDLERLIEELQGGGA